MKVQVLFFSQLKDAMRAAEMEIEVAPNATVEDLLGKLYQQTPKLRDWDESLLIGAGVEFVERDYLLRPNESIAIMPPVQGG